MHVPFVDLKAQYAAICKDVQTNVDRALKDASFILGPEVAQFENRFAVYCGCEHAIGVASGLDALKLSLRALEIGPGDEVITSANTYIATALAISSVGAKPVLVDADPQDYNMNPCLLADALTPRTRAVLPVHLYGQPARMDEIADVVRGRDVCILEDASQAHGARYHDRRVGSLGNAGAFSLYPGKNLGAYGDAGIVTTDSSVIAGRLTRLRNYGSDRKYYHAVLGENSRLDTIQAAILLAKLPHLDAWNTARRRAAQGYRERLAGVGDLILPTTRPESEAVYHLFVIRTAQRDALMRHLAARDITCIIHYPIPIHMQEAYAGHGWQRGQFPVTEQLASEILSLPMFPEITDAQLDAVAEAIRDFFSG
jgi:dTDP-4-amino-4,6-dideoxygalactose transaminase